MRMKFSKKNVCLFQKFEVASVINPRMSGCTGCFYDNISVCVCVWRICCAWNARNGASWWLKQVFMWMYVCMCVCVSVLMDTCKFLVAIQSLCYIIGVCAFQVHCRHNFVVNLRASHSKRSKRRQLHLHTHAHLYKRHKFCSIRVGACTCESVGRCVWICIWVCMCVCLL